MLDWLPVLLTALLCIPVYLASHVGEQELQRTTVALSEARQGEAEALVKFSRLKHTLGDIEGIVKWARSPSGSLPNAMINANRYLFARLLSGNDL